MLNIKNLLFNKNKAETLLAGFKEMSEITISCLVFELKKYIETFIHIKIK